MCRAQDKPNQLQVYSGSGEPLFPWPLAHQLSDPFWTDLYSIHGAKAHTKQIENLPMLYTPERICCLNFAL